MRDIEAGSQVAAAYLRGYRAGIARGRSDARAEVGTILARAAERASSALDRRVERAAAQRFEQAP